MTYCNLVPKFLRDFQYWERKKTSILYVQALHEKPNKKILYATLASLAKQANSPIKFVSWFLEREPCSLG